MTMLALVACSCALLYGVRCELLGTAVTEAQGQANAVAERLRAQDDAGARTLDATSLGAMEICCVSITPAQVDTTGPATATVLTGDGPYVVAVEPDSAPMRAAQDAIVRLLLVGIPPLLILVAALTWFAMGRALRPVEAIRAEFAEITAHDLHHRVPEPHGGDEVSRLAATMNMTLDQLERAVSRLRTFVSDASHELRGPLTTLLTRLELAVARPERADWLVLAEESHQDADRLREIVEDLLLLARLDTRRLPGGDIFVPGEVVGQVVHGRTVAVRDNSGGSLVKGSRTAILRLVTNLVDNAVRYARSSVEVSLATGPAGLIIEVTDDGPGIAVQDRLRVFDRFVRLDEARTRGSAAGTGLGLAIARDIAQAHGGTLTAADAGRVGGGARLVLILPTVESHSTHAATSGRDRKSIHD